MDRVGLTSLALRYTSAWCSQNPERVAALFAEDGSLMVDGGAAAQGRAAIAKSVHDLMTALPGLTVQMDGVEGPHPDVPHAIFRARLTAGGQAPATGRLDQRTSREEWQLAPDGLIQHARLSFDRASNVQAVKSPPSVDMFQAARVPDGPKGLGGWLIPVGCIDQVSVHC